MARRQKAALWPSYLIKFSVITLAASAWAAPTRSSAQEAEQVVPPEGEVVGEDTGEVIVVTGTRTPQRLSEAPVATEVITAEEIAASGAESLAGVLEERSGVEIVQTFGGSGVRLQGLDPEYVLILVDGQRIAGRVDGTVDLSRFSVENIEQIEIVRGASTSLYGADALGGVINIVTRRPVAIWEATGNASAGDGERLDVRGSAGRRWERADAQVSGSWHRRAPVDLDPSTPATNLSGFDAWEVAGRGGVELGSALRLGAQADYARRDLRGVDGNGAGAVLDRRNLSETFALSARPELTTERGAALRALVGWSLFRDQLLIDQRGGAALDQAQETIEQAGQLNLQSDLPLGDAHLLTLGVEGLLEGLESPRLRDGRGRRWRAAALAQDEWRVEPRLVIVPGARVDLDSIAGAAPTGSLALRFEPGAGFTVRVAGGRGWRAPSFRELLLRFENPGAGYVVEGSADLRPESSANVGLNTTWSGLNGALEADLNLFWNDIHDLIEIQTLTDSAPGEPARFGYVNVAEARTQGLEVGLRARPWSGGRFGLGYVLLDARDRTLDRPLEGRSRHRATLDLTQRLAPLDLSGTLRAALNGPRPFFVDDDGDGAEETVSVDPWISMDARLEWGVWDYIAIFAGGENLLNAGDERFLPLTPRRFYGGLTGRY